MTRVVGIAIGTPLLLELAILSGEQLNPTARYYVVQRYLETIWMPGSIARKVIRLGGDGAPLKLLRQRGSSRRMTGEVDVHDFGVKLRNRDHFGVR